MDRTTLKIFNSELTFIGDIEDYISFYFVRSFFQAKEFQLVAPLKYIDILKQENYIYLNKYKSMIIEEIEINETREQITVKGRDIKSILEGRVIIPPYHEAYDKYKSNAESVIKHYVDVCCINPVDKTRKIPNLSIASNKNRGLTIGWESRYKNLASEIESISRSGEVGWFVYLDPKAKKLIFDVEIGINRVATQNINSRVIFSSKFDNISNAIHTYNSVSYKNFAYVGGQGEGVDREVKEVKKNEAIGLGRREVFIDARDISESDSLEDRGLVKLNQFDYILNTESTVLNKSLIYEKDWNLGDIVTIKNKLRNDDLRVTEVREIYEDNLTIEIAVGTIGNTIVEQINNNISSIPNEVGTTPWYPTVDSNGNITWELRSSIDRPKTQNIKGPKGDTGATGAQGQQGIQGLKGDKGNQGIQGIQGLKGDKGDQGSQGLQGVKGDKGDTGVIGPQGLTGPQGSKGDNGSQGIQGLKGDKGDTWRPTVDSSGNISWIINNGTTAPAIINIKGPKGDVGATGVQGVKGDTGALGPQGIQGIQGLKGDKGDQGIQGVQGIKGNDGITPTIGTNGNWYLGNTDTGKPTRGIQGIQGSIGLQGHKGDTGATGVQGIKGDTGATGSQGPPGKDGTEIITSTTRPSGQIDGRIWIQII